MTRDTFLPPSLTDQAACDLAALEALSGDLGPTVVPELVALFTAEMRTRLQRITEHGGAGTRLLRGVHTLKGRAGTVMATRLGSLGTALEARLRADGTADTGNIAALQAAFDAYSDSARSFTERAAVAPP